MERKAIDALDWKLRRLTAHDFLAVLLPLVVAHLHEEMAVSPIPETTPQFFPSTKLSDEWYESTHPVVPPSSGAPSLSSSSSPSRPSGDCGGGETLFTLSEDIVQCLYELSSFMVHATLHQPAFLHFPRVQMALAAIFVAVQLLIKSRELPPSAVSKFLSRLSRYTIYVSTSESSRTEGWWRRGEGNG